VVATTVMMGQNFFGCMDGIGDDNDFGNIFLVRGLVNTTPNCKELSFCTSDKDHMMESFDWWTVGYVHV